VDWWTVAWEIQDATGKVYDLQTDAYYVPQSDFRLLIPQVYFKKKNNLQNNRRQYMRLVPSVETLLQFPHHKNQPKMLTRAGTR